MRGDITWLDQLTQGVDTDHVKIFFAVGSAELFTIKLLTFLVCKEYFLDLGDHFEASSGAFGLHLVADHLLHFAVADDLQYLLSDKDFVILKVDVAPRQPKCLASSQSAVDGKDDGDIDDVLFGVFEQCFDLVHRVEVADELFRLRALHSVHGIVFEDLLADGVFEGGVQQIVIMQNRLLAVAVLAQVIVLLNLRSTRLTIY